MIFYSREDDAKATRVCHELSKGPDSSATVDTMIPAPANSFVIITGSGKFRGRKNFRVLQRPDGSRISAERMKDEGFEIPAWAEKAKAVIAVRTDDVLDRDASRFKACISSLFEVLTGRPYSPHDRNLTVLRRREKKAARERARKGERRDNAACGLGVYAT